MRSHRSPRRISLAILCFGLAACQAAPTERAEELAPKVHRLTVDLAGEEPVESRLAKAATAVCPTGYDRQEDEAMPPDSPRYRVWLVRCR